MLICPGRDPASPFPTRLDGSIPRLRTAPRVSIPVGARNRLLEALPDSAFEELWPLLERVELKRRQVLHERNVPLTHGYFIERGAAALLSRSGDGGTLEVGTIGCYDFAGLPIVLGTGRTPLRCVVQVPGEALRIQAEDLIRVVDEIPALRGILLRYVQATLVESAQLSVCNASHTLHQRLARWLLVAQDRVGSSQIPLTHQCASRALGVRRAGVTTALGRMEEGGILRRGRGTVLISDRQSLEDQSCDCYRVVRSEHQRIACNAEDASTNAQRRPVRSAALATA